MKRHLLLFLLAVHASAAPQHSNIQGQYRFKSLTINDGLAHNKVNTIYQDLEGFIWFGTNEGLSRYDGYSIVNYRYNPKDTTSLKDNIIKSLIVDRNGDLWIGADGRGLMVYDRNQDRFIELTYGANNKFHYIISLYMDAMGDIWCGSMDTLIHLDGATHQAIDFWKLPGTGQDNRIHSVIEDHSGNLWIGTLGGGVTVFNPSTAKFVNYSHNPQNPRSISGNSINTIYLDRLNHLWIGTNDHGLNLFNDQDSSFIHISVDAQNPRSDRVRSLIEDRHGRLWVGTRSGLYLKDPDALRFYRYAHNEHDFSKLEDNSIYSIFIDASDVMWIGTYAGGANYADLNQKNFVHYSFKKNNSYYLNNNIVFCLCEDDNGNLWIGTENGGLNYLDRNTGQFSYMIHRPGFNSPSSNNIKSIVTDSRGNLWIGTYQGGLDFFDRSSGTFSHYRHDSKNLNSLRNDNIYSLHLDSDDQLWIATAQGLDRYDIPNHRFIHYDGKMHKTWDKIVEARFLFEDSKKRLWIGTFTSGVYVWDKNEILHFHPDVLASAVNTILEDTIGNFWFGGENGLFYWNEQMDSIHIAGKHDLLLNTIQGILEHKGSLWISTSSAGLIHLSNAVSHPDSFTVRVFDVDDGVQSRQFNNNSCLKTGTGELCFGGINGFNTFNPDAIHENLLKPLISITNFKLFNETVTIGQQFENRIILKKAISQTDTIELSHKAKAFTMEFAAFHFAHPSKNQYAYQMTTGRDNSWNYIGTQRSVNFTSLSPGRYEFRVKAANPDGLWNDEYASVKINIIPPFWQKISFRISALILSLALAFLIYKWRTASIRRRNEELENEVAARTKEVVQRKEEIEQAYNRMNEAIVKINQSVDKMKKLSDIVAHTSSEFNESSQRLASGASEHASSIAEMSGSLQELFASASANTSNAQDTNVITAQTQQLMKRSLEDLNTLSTLMKRIQLSTNETESVIRTMAEIATMVHMLSINAAIEAMRAGEYGKGFQAVATEVQELAEQSETAVQTTKNLIHNAIEHVEKGSQLNKEVVKRFKIVGKSVEKITGLINEISSASVQQKLGIDQVNTGIEQLNQVMTMSSEIANLTVERSEQLAHNADELQMLVQMLTGAIRHLAGNNNNQ
jgi:ligand-binding sensor domain-containing protein/methyl-accepting chemotaxis protein